MPPSADLLLAEDASEKKDIGRNGTYLVMRDLQQDVRRFWQFLNKHADGNAAFMEKLASAMVGRTRDGRSTSADSTGAHRWHRTGGQ